MTDTLKELLDTYAKSIRDCEQFLAAGAVADDVYQHAAYAGVAARSAIEAHWAELEKPVGMLLAELLTGAGIEPEDFGDVDLERWWVPAEPGPIDCATLSEALRESLDLSERDALSRLSDKFPPRDIPIRVSSGEPRSVRRWQIDVPFTGEPPTLHDALNLNAALRQIASQEGSQQ